MKNYEWEYRHMLIDFKCLYEKAWDDNPELMSDADHDKYKKTIQEMKILGIIEIDSV